MNIFTTRKPRRYERKPYFSDPRKEALEARIRKVKREMGIIDASDYKPEETIRGTFASGTSHLRRRQENGEISTSKRNVKIAVWLIVLGALLYVLLK